MKTRFSGQPSRPVRRLRCPAPQPSPSGWGTRIARVLPPPSRGVRATYRLQFNREFTFAQARAQIGYLQALGISDLYASPVFLARQDSPHGYDVCDHNRLNPDLGAAPEFRRLTRTLRMRDMGVVLDLVPNHMGIGDRRNRWWLDVLQHGPESPFAAFFDIDWDRGAAAGGRRLALPFLSDSIDRCLERGELLLVWENAALWLAYFENRFPLSPPAYALVFRCLMRRLTGHRLSPALRRRLERVGSDLEASAEPEPATLPRRLRFEIARAQLSRLLREDRRIHGSWQETVSALNRGGGGPGQVPSLAGLVAVQHYRLADWRETPRVLNYRRFFDIPELAGLRMERPEVFQATHRLVFRLLLEAPVAGLRIDHPDGLRDPLAYLRRLQSEFIERRLRPRLRGVLTAGEVGRLARAWVIARSDPGGAVKTSWPLAVWVEKILSEGETLPQHWPVAGTTGYEFLNLLNGLWIDPRARGAFSRVYRKFAPGISRLPDEIHRNKCRVLTSSLRPELEGLSRQAADLSSGQGTPEEFESALAALIAALPVYRAYVSETRPRLSPAEKAYLERALAEARRRNARLPSRVFDALGGLLGLDDPVAPGVAPGDPRLRFRLSFQQLSGPAMAKGLEDTTFYTYNRFVSLNEVGGNPACWGTSLETFHRANARRLADWPDSLLATATHDTKRGEDVRARLDVLSEMPGDWTRAVARWRQWNQPLKQTASGQPAPEANDEYLLYQTLIGAWDDSPGAPADPFARRIQAYLLKAIREAKRRTSWTDPNLPYEEAAGDFVAALLDPSRSRAFLADLRGLARTAAFHGRLNSLAQTLLKLTAPGVPDFYQGTELWDLSLVDPDNRRPVDFALRRRHLNELVKAWPRTPPARRRFARSLWRAAADGRVKLFLIWRVLNYRREHPDLFRRGAYVPVAVAGRHREHVCAFRRGQGTDSILVVVPRLTLRLAGAGRAPLGPSVWGNTRLQLPADDVPASFRDLFTGATLRTTNAGRRPELPLGRVLRDFPVALLESLED